MMDFSFSMRHPSEHVVPNFTVGGFVGEIMVLELMSYQMIRLRKM